MRGDVAAQLPIEMIHTLASTVRAICAFVNEAGVPDTYVSIDRFIALKCGPNHLFSTQWRDFQVAVGSAWPVMPKTSHGCGQRKRNGTRHRIDSSAILLGSGIRPR